MYQHMFNGFQNFPFAFIIPPIYYLTLLVMKRFQYTISKIWP